MKFTRHLVPGFLIVCCLGFARPCGAQQFFQVVTNLGSLGGSDCRAVALNDRRQIAGTLRVYSQRLGTTVQRAFLWQENIFNELVNTNRLLVASHATGLNSLSDVAGWFTLSYAQAPGVNRAFVWRRGELKDLGTLGGSNAFAQAINDAGDVAGSAQLPNGLMHAVLWRDGKPTDLGTFGGPFSHAYDVNASEQVVGVAATTNSVRRAFTWEAGKMTPLGTLGGVSSQANSINARGEVAGVAQTTNGQFHAFLHAKGRLRDLGTFGGDFSFAYANDDYHVVGVAEDGKGERRAFFFTEEKLRDLNTMIPADSGWFLVEATAINSRSEILCTARAKDGTLSVLLLAPSAGPNPGKK